MPTTTDASRRPLPESLLDAFPTRPVVLRPGGFPLGPALWTVTLLVAVLATVVLSWRSLAPDFALGDEATLAPGAGVDGSCSISARVLSWCDVTLTYLDGEEVRETKRNYFWVELDRGADYTQVVVSPDGEHASLQLAQDRLINRTLTSAGVVLLGLWLAKLGSDHLRRALRVRRDYGAEGGLELRPVPAHVHKLVGKSRIGGPTPVFAAEVDGRVVRPVHGAPANEAELLQTASGMYVAVVPASGAGDPLLLDAGLTGLELSDEERSAVLAAAASS